MKARDVMTPDPACCPQDASAREAAELMQQQDCGCIPVVDDERSMRLVGVVTDRDLALRGLARGRGPDTPVRELMSGGVGVCSPDTELREVERIMADRRVRRIPVVDDDGRCRGIVAQADIAREAMRRNVGEDELARLVGTISEPDDRPSRRTRPPADDGAPDERQNSILQGIGVPPESRIGRAAEDERRRRAAEGPPIGGGMGGTSDADSPGDEAAASRARREPGHLPPEGGFPE